MFFLQKVVAHDASVGELAIQANRAILAVD